ncbi:MAG: acetolactate decarboxylase [Phycisphaerae bacterium]|nr:acetolactate decarboxylase [Phycisphaerae bacterium]
MKNWTFRFLFLGLLWLAVGFGGCGSPAEGTLYQVSTLQALVDGVYDGSTTIGCLKRHGDLGLGTFNKLDGEMVVLDGVVYRVGYDGKVNIPADDTKTPFANITAFRPTQAIASPAASKPMNFKQWQKFVDSKLPTKNIPYAICMTGEFAHVKTRSVPRQHKPFPRLVEVVKNQSLFGFEKVRGTIVGFRFPGYFDGLNVTGYHIHFLTEDRTGGGHVLDFSIADFNVQVAPLHKFVMQLPTDSAFGKADVSSDKTAEIHRVETLKK